MEGEYLINVHTYMRGDKDVPLETSVDSIWQMIYDHAKSQANKTAIIGVDVTTDNALYLSYRELFAAVVRCGNYLYSQHNICEGTHFSFAYDNRAEVLILSLAGAVLGASSTILDTRRDVVDRMKYKLSLTESKVFITHPRGSSQETWKKKVQMLREKIPFMPIVELGSAQSLMDELAEYDSTPQFPIVGNLDHVHATLFTSGTTADPKGVQLTSSNLLFNAVAIQQWLRITQDDRFAAILPLHHINSTTFSLATLLAGGTLVLLSEPPKERFWDFMAKYQVTITSIVQKIVYQLLELQNEFEHVQDNLVLTRIQVGSDVVDPIATERFIEKYRIPLHQGYGLTEVALRATGVPMGLRWDDYLMLVRRNTIGTPLEGVNVSVLNEYGVEAKEGEKGEICVRGPIVMKRYLKNFKATEIAFDGGWFHTGDIGWYEVIFDRPFFFYHSRTKEIIKKGGAMLSPDAIDRAVRKRFPELEDAFSFGYPDKAWGEDVWIVVTFKDNVKAHRRVEIIKEIVEFGEQELIPGLPKFEAPTRVLDWEVEFPGQSIPRASTMKVQRTRQKELVIARFPPLN
jgi:acyl-CoA synthetase (AMP-forming)/AMP-acid ligase II